MLPFSTKSVDFNSNHSFSSLVIDYLLSSKDTESLQSFLVDDDGFGHAIEERLKRESKDARELLSLVILEQYKKPESQISTSDQTRQIIASLTDKNTFTVTTGHQLNLFTGPLYFIYKIISTINLAKKLKEKFPVYNFVPLYWMASEDHDLEEINHIHLFGKKIEWKPSSKGAAGRIKCEGVSETIGTVKEMLSNAGIEKILTLFEKAYRPENNLADATRIIVHELFSAHGLIILDADDKRLKKQFIPEMKDDVLNHFAYRLVGETIVELEKNYKVQVHPREINLFYLDENSRERIVEEHGNFNVLNENIHFSKEEFLREIENYPEKFSPNVVLRPLFQEKILPNIAYVGGPAEISYWLEYKKMFEHYGSNLPVLVLRSCAMIFDSASNDKLKKLGLEPGDIFMSEDGIIKKYLQLKLPEEFSLESLRQRTMVIFEEAIEKVNSIDPTLKATAEAEKQKTLNSLNTIEERVRRAEKRKHEIAISQIRKLKEKFFPEKVLQERYENILTFYSKYGDDFLEELFKHLNPLEKKFLLLVEE